LRPVLALFLALGLSACSTVPASRAPSAACEGTAMVATQLFFGMGLPGGGEVSEAAWQAFVARHIDRRFPEGYTIIESRGSWWSEAEGRQQRESSRLVVRVHDGGPDDERAIREIVERYKAQFRQESVLRWDAAACVWF
jgi:hypothetical protein